MRRLAAVALTACWLVLPACAQHHASSGGFAAHASAPAHSGFSAPHSGFAGPAPTRSAGPARFSPPRYGFAGPQRFAPQHRGGAPGNPGWHRGDNRDHHRRPYISPYRAVYAYPYYVAPWIGYGPGYFDDSDSSDYDNSQAAAGANPDTGNYADQGGYGDPNASPNGPYPYQANPGYDGQGAPPWPSLGPNAPRHPYGSAPQSAQPPAPAPSAQAAEQSITLVFKDGRPSIQIRNYLLTTSTLYTGDGLRREIPLSDIDLAATADANRDTGVDFRLPQGQSH